MINNGIAEQDLLDSAHQAFTLGWRVIKLYFMIGLPTETDEDLEALIDLSARVKRSGRGTEGGGNVNVSASTFVPKAHTPFQWEAQLGIEETVRRQEKLRDGLSRKRLKLKWHDARTSFLEGVLARGDRRLGPVLAEAVKRGCRFDGWREHFNWDNWMAAFDTIRLEPSWYLRQRHPGEIFPWDHIDAGVSKDFLIRERQAALLQKETPDCRNGACSACGLCDFDIIQPRKAQCLPTPPLPAQKGDDPQDTPHPFSKIRLTLRKSGRTTAISHLEFMTLLHRAVQRAALPIRFSEGFHPAPRISFGDALPIGVASETELVDLELTERQSPQDVLHRLNKEMPADIQVLHAEEWPLKGPSPGASLATATYRVQLPANPPPDLEQRLTDLLNAETVLTTRIKKKRPMNVDLRPWVEDLSCDGQTLQMTLRAGSPIVLASYLLNMGQEAVRCLEICKTRVTFKEE